MSKTITVTIPDEAYEALQAAARSANRTPEELAADTVATRFHTEQTTPEAAQSGQPAPLSPEQLAAARLARDHLTEIMRARGHLVDPHTLPPYPGIADLPPKGSPEEAQMLEEIGNDASDALERMGIDIADLVER